MYLNSGQEPRLYFWRDNVVHEVDLRDAGMRLHAWECKSGMTYVPEWTDSVEYWRKLAERSAGKLRVVYGGTESFNRGGIRVVAWNEVAAAAR